MCHLPAQLLGHSDVQSTQQTAIQFVRTKVASRNSEKPRFPHAARTHRRARHHRRYEVRTDIGVLRRVSALLNWLQQVSPNIARLQELKAADSGFPIRAVDDACCGASAASINAHFEIVADLPVARKYADRLATPRTARVSQALGAYG
jgi:hypothetical protein